ncbi:anhydro-N-acetylmuramic acid kinase [Thiomicrorhabdus xiamenensis]|uniref:Anhydro-N-acetylmuramic acid kinase n=2 Tax=Thiomicrorhabdus xiamenensis TaxID=2739063 RepID=A0A7D4P6H6_9GAMM|nr:anhydro-N-acetylmuramic acid kinase [Thiomicrorhabdus xiamenensis]
MSGTSVDAVDAALIAICDQSLQLKHFTTTPIPDKLKQLLLECNSEQKLSLQSFSQLHSQMGQLFAAAVAQLLRETGLEARDITAIGSHGQTIYHAPDLMMSLQIGHPAIIAKHSGITTVGDFRVDDMALGGQGAPFAPVFHQRLFSEPEQTVIAVNIGGIANISLLPADHATEAVTGWDTGPGNGLIDEACQKLFACSYDRNGDLARQGAVQTAVLDSLVQDSYFQQPAPKSSGRDYFNWPWLVEKLGNDFAQRIDAHDLLATLTELTAVSIAQQVRPALGEQTGNSVWICGGGAFNRYLLERIQAHLPACTVCSSSDAGHDPNAIEGMLFAWLAHERLHNRPVKLSAVTGAERDAVLGGIWHP